MSILEGSVVYIDDEFSDPTRDAGRFYRELLSGGRPIAAYDRLPPASHLAHWDGLSLVVLDWNLTETDARLGGAATLVAGAREEMLSFLAGLLERYFCPVFIVSASAPEAIESVLRSSGTLPSDTLGSRVRVIHKSDVKESLLTELENEVRKDPVLSTLRTWEQEYQRAKNRMFIDFSKLGSDWLVYIAKCAGEGGTDSGQELIDALYGNLRHRADPIAFDIDSLRARELPAEGESLRRVVHGRCVLDSNRLHKGSIMPGDFFSSWKSADPQDAIWLNLTPACYTVRGRTRGSSSAGDVRLHLIRGVPETVSGTESAESLRKKRQSAPRFASVDVLYAGKSYKFDFKTLQTFSWGTVAAHRLGRLLPPYVSAVQQRHASYLTTEGLPVVLPAMYKQSQRGEPTPAAGGVP